MKLDIGTMKSHLKINLCNSVPAPTWGHLEIFKLALIHINTLIHKCIEKHTNKCIGLDLGHF